MGETAKQYLKNSPEPKLILAGDKRVLLGDNREPPKVDCRVLSEEYYQRMLERIRELEILEKNMLYGRVLR